MINENLSKQKLSPQKFLLNGSLFVVLISLIGYILLKDQNLDAITTAMAGANPLYLLAAIGCGAIFISCEAINIGRSLTILGHKPSHFQLIKYACTGFFFSSITPSSIGGQPMQVYAMHKDKISISHSTLALLAELLSFQVTTVLLSLIGFGYNHTTLTQLGGNLQLLFFLGLALNLGILVLLLLALFKQNTLAHMITVLFHFLSLCKLPNVDKKLTKALIHVAQYQEGSTYIKSNLRRLVPMIITSTIQLVAINSIPYLIYQSFGLTGASYLSILFMQCILTMSVAIVPLPGTVGLNEGVFGLLYRTLFGSNLVKPAMLLSRGISFYLFVALTGSLLLALSIIRKLTRKNLSQA